MTCKLKGKFGPWYSDILTTKQGYNGCRFRSHCGNKDVFVNDKKVFITATGSLNIARSTAVCEKYYAWIIFHR